MYSRGISRKEVINKNIVRGYFYRIIFNEALFMRLELIKR